MIPDLLPAVHAYREVGVYIDAANVILLVAVAYLLYRLLWGVHQLQSVARFWMDNWNGTPGIGGLSAIDTTVLVHQKSTALANGVEEATPRLRYSQRGRTCTYGAS
jgi:hypothetical protein